MDVWVYIVLQAPAGNLLDNIEYLKNFCNPNFMLSETGCYLQSLEIAALFLKSVDESKYRNTPSIRKDTFVLVAKDLIYENPIGKEANLFKYVEDVKVIGYGIQICLEWIADPCKLVI